MKKECRIVAKIGKCVNAISSTAAGNSSSQAFTAFHHACDFGARAATDGMAAWIDIERSGGMAASRHPAVSLLVRAQDAVGLLLGSGKRFLRLLRAGDRRL